MLAALVATSSAAPTPGERSGNAYMDCGTAPLCGVLVLETGFGSGNYKHQEPGVHGLWPETGKYGSSKCLRPTVSSGEPGRLYSCYEQEGASKSQLLSFQSHEWDKHGRCAGVEDADDFFSQLCALAEAPLSVMKETRSAGRVDLDDFAQQLKAKAFPVFSQDEHNMQVELAACAGRDGKWHLAAPEEFGARCGGDAAVEEAKVGVDCHTLTDKASCDKASCSWCVAGAVPPSCKTVDEAKQLPPSIFDCDRT